MAELFERMVLPRPNDDGWGLHNLWEELAKEEPGRGGSVWSLIVDFENASCQQVPWPVSKGSQLPKLTILRPTPASSFIYGMH